MGMDTNISKLVNNLNSAELNVLLKLYYNKDGIIKNLKETEFEKESVQNLIDKNLIDANISGKENILSLTTEGFSVCGTVMFEKIKENKEVFNEKIKSLPERAVATLVKRVMWKDIVSKESGIIDNITEPYNLDESLWYEGVLLNDERFVNILGEFYNCLEEIGFVKKIDGESWCSPEVEKFLKEEYKSLMDLTWLEEDSLKYYYFYYVYAQGQKNLINFAGEGLEYRSMFFKDDSNATEYWLKMNATDPRTLLSSLGISENRIMAFLSEMEKIDIVSKRYYPLSSFSFFSEEDEIFVIKDIKKYMGFIEKKFLKHVVDSLLE
jgi:regulator of replication initiation timing